MPIPSVSAAVAGTAHPGRISHAGHRKAGRQKRRSSLTSCQACDDAAADVVDFFMALLSFRWIQHPEPTGSRRCNAYLTFSTAVGTSPAWVYGVFPDRIESGIATCGLGEPATSRSGMPGCAKNDPLARIDEKTSGRVSRRHGASRPRNGSHAVVMGSASLTISRRPSGVPASRPPLVHAVLGVRSRDPRRQGCGSTGNSAQARDDFDGYLEQQGSWAARSSTPRSRCLRATAVTTTRGSPLSDARGQPEGPRFQVPWDDRRRCGRTAAAEIEAKLKEKGLKSRMLSQQAASKVRARRVRGPEQRHPLVRHRP